jgi:hypothetical protein
LSGRSSSDQEAVAYELENIESKITERISVAASETLHFDVPVFLQELDVECSKIKRAFRHQAVSFENERLVKRYFHFHQESLIDLIDTLHGEKHADQPVLESIVHRLAGLLNYLEEHFPDYFNQDMKMPRVHLSIVTNELREFCTVLCLKFKDTNVDAALITLMKQCINSHITAGGNLTFRQFYYFKLLRLNIENIETLESKFETLELVKVLLHCNFNTEQFYTYVLKYITRAVNSLPTIGEKVDQLTYYLKFANQELSNHSIGYHYQQIPISVQISDWLSQELMYLKTKQQLLPTIAAEEIMPLDFKLNFDLSVPQLAFLFRAFIESGVIQNKNTSELIRFLSKYVKTKKSESISSESFRIKYYSVESGTKDAVKKTLQSVLNFISRS